jgi:poly(3-hydroxybutyrate) depolymerase
VSRAALIAAVVATAAALVVAPADAARVIHDWPCAGCIVQVPSNAGTKRLPLLVALHGDEGDPGLTASVWGPVADALHVVLFAPHCPQSEGCLFPNGAGTTSSWWGWLQAGSGYDDLWIGRQTSIVEQRFRIDRAREYLAGWSGGADYLGWYALRHAGRFAGAAFVAGGVPYTGSCPSRRLPTFFLMGANDFRYASGQPEQVRSLLVRCGSPTSEVVEPGADHQTTIASLQSGYARRVLTWLLQYRTRR